MCQPLGCIALADGVAKFVRQLLLCRHDVQLQLLKLFYDGQQDHSAHFVEFAPSNFNLDRVCALERIDIAAPLPPLRLMERYIYILVYYEIYLYIQMCISVYIIYLLSHLCLHLSHAGHGLISRRMLILCASFQFLFVLCLLFPVVRP